MVVVMYASVVLSVVIGLSTHAQWVVDDSTHGTQENDECFRQGDQVWYCKKDRECPSARLVLRNGDSLRSCSWKDATTHIICCPPNSHDSAYTKSISEIKCSLYHKNLCKVNFQKRSLDSKQTPEDVPLPQDEVPTDEDYPKVCVAVFGGVEAAPLTHSHMALIGYGTTEEDVSWRCGGSLISENFVLSAAHCSDTFSGPAKWVRLGDLDTASESDIAKPQQFRIVERLVHPDYRPPAIYNDIVLFRLDRDVTFDEYVKPACLHQNTADPLTRVLAMGWGQIESGGPRSTTLLVAALNIDPVEECKRNFSSDSTSLARGIDTKTMICASAPGKNTCRGDSGGPLVLADRTHCLATQVGITSFGGPCDEELLPGVYVRAAFFLPWIESKVWPAEQKT